LARWWNPGLALGLTVLTFSTGVWAAGRAEKFWGRDSRRIVIDEISGMFLAASLVPATVNHLAAAFFIFRLLDILKPPPARKAEHLSSGWGVMADDLVAGAYTALIVWVLRSWI
jgi:phosphatidylglycerophosphatase A